MIYGYHSNMNDSPIRRISGRVSLYGSPYFHDPWSDLQEITITRTGEKGKFFGFGICQQATIKIVDKDNIIYPTKKAPLSISFDINNSGVYDAVCPEFYVSEFTRDINSNVVTITAYDALDKATSRTFSELVLEAPYTIYDVVSAIALKLQIGVDGNSITLPFSTVYEDGANFSGDETLRTVLNAIAEATQTIYYIDHYNRLVFKQLDPYGTPVLTIGKDDYYELSTSHGVYLTKIVHATELGDNIEHGDNTGATQYIRDNPFWSVREDLDTVIVDAYNRVEGLRIMPYKLKWRGNFLTEIGDCISLQTEDSVYVSTFILDDSFTYNGGFSQTCEWEYTPDSDKETANNPTSLGEKLNQTFAKVDKANQQIILLAEETSGYPERMTQLQLTLDGITSQVSTLEQVTGDIPDEINTLRNEVEQKITSEDVTILVKSELSKGTDKVTTSTGYTFNDEGLTVSKSGSQMTTQISEDGMKINRDETEVLTANNEGVKAEDLHATTYLIIGNNSRFEDYVDSNNRQRTGCFWIGG